VLQVLQGERVIQNVNGCLEHQLLHCGLSPYFLAGRPPWAGLVPCDELVRCSKER
jgi:hypothetical protein